MDGCAKTFIVEDSPVILENLVATLEELAPVKVVGTAPDEASALEWIHRNGAEVDLMIIDIFLKSGSGLGVLKATSSHNPPLRRVVLTNYATADIRKKCLELGAGFAWVFGQCVDLPDGSGDFYADQTLLERLRLEALEALPGDTERWSLLASVVQQPGAYALGELLTKVSFCSDIERGLLVEDPSRDLAGLACAFATARAVSEPSGWTRALVLRWTDGGRREDAVAVLLRLPATPAHWDLVDSLSQELSAAYWSQLGHFIVEEPAAATRALRHLLDNANIPLALRLAGHLAPSLSSAILVEVLEQTAAAWKRLRESEGSTMLSHYVDRILGVGETAGNCTVAAPSASHAPLVRPVPSRSPMACLPSSPTSNARTSARRRSR